MRRLLFLLLTGGLLGLFYAGCDFAGEDVADRSVVLTGRVVTESGDPIPDAFVRVPALGLSQYTDDKGLYRFEAEADSTMDIQVIANKSGFNSAGQAVLVVPGSEVNALLTMVAIEASEPESGPASNIILLSGPEASIGVKESGSPEVAQIDFLVADSLGRPVTLEHAVNVNFRLGASPGGGEFIYPQVAGTNNNGKVTANLSSGTAAGVVQIIAEAQVEGRTISSKPVAVSIHGGLPDLNHFTLGPEEVNFPGLTKLGLDNTIQVIVGDEYANPVKPGTAVYFTTNHGLISGSTTTDETGRGAVQLTSANPLPADGIAVITASTGDKNDAVIQRQTAVVLSAPTRITLNPATVTMNQAYEVTVDDRNLNPLAPGTQIQVTVDGKNVKAVGDTEVELDDTIFSGGLAYENVVRGPGYTKFYFSTVKGDEMVQDSTGTEAPAPSELNSISIRVSSPNGNLDYTILGSSVSSKTEGAAIETLSSGAVMVRKEEE